MLFWGFQSRNCANGVDETISTVEINLLDTDCDEFYRICELLEVLTGCLQRYLLSVAKRGEIETLKPGVVTEVS